MKIITKIMLASALTLSIAAPASAAYFEQQTQVSSPGMRAHDTMGNHAMGRSTREQRATDSMAFEPGGAQIDPDYRYFHDFGIGSQS
jgi:hypothetical protein